MLSTAADRRRLVLVATPLILFAAAGALAPLLAPVDPLATDLGARLRPPTWSHPLGTDQLGRDQLSRTLFAARTSLVTAGAVLVASFSVGVVIGSIAGYAGGAIDRVVVRLVDVLQSFPTLVLALAIVGVSGGGLVNIVFALSLSGWAPYARIARARVGGTRRSAHVDALRVLGARPRRIFGRHLLPVALGPSLVYASVDIGTVVLSVATLSFLGIGGIDPPAPEWGQMIVDARAYLRSAPWLTLAPGIAITAVVLASNLPGEHLAGHRRRPFAAAVRRRRSRKPRPPEVRTATPMAEPPSDAIFEVSGLTLGFQTPVGRKRVLDGVSYRVRRGETLAIVGESGTGKTVSALAPFGLLGPEAAIAGSARLQGRELVGLDEGVLRTLRGRTVGVVFQDALVAFNPLLTIGAQVDEAVRNAAAARPRALRARTLELLALAGLPDPRGAADSYPHELSGGMRQRAMVATALAGEPDLLIADEPTTALDVTTQATLLERLGRLRDELGMAMIFISHDLAVVSELADSVAVMYAGRIIEHGDRASVLKRADHPYTRGLLAAVPPVRPEPGARFVTIPGVAPDGPDALAGCPFAPRCAWRRPRCEAQRPSLERVEPAVDDDDGAHHSACWVHPSRQPVGPGGR